jgi:hypothetical protein
MRSTTAFKERTTSSARCPRRCDWLSTAGFALSVSVAFGAAAQQAPTPAPSAGSGAPASAASSGSAAPAAGSDADLAKQLSNPLASLVSVPFQFNWEQGVGYQDGTRTILNVQPSCRSRSTTSGT